jgi:tRNA pseudouridine55 synthase
MVAAGLRGRYVSRSRMSDDVVTGPPSGVLVIDKPLGPTSHDVVARLRKVLRTRAVGHAGTLDPMATGILVVAVGEATKLVPWLSSATKAYEATVTLGVETDTLDAQGREVRREAVPPEVLDALASTASWGSSPVVRRALGGELARTSQVPPAYSAIRADGVRAFVLARRGEAPEMAPREVRVASLEIVGCRGEPAEVDLTMEVSKGYYVRSLARDFARSLGTVGHLSRLRRTRSGCFTMGEAVPLERTAAELHAHMVPLRRVAARTLAVARLTETGVRDARFGRVIAPGDLQTASPPNVPCAWLDANEALVAVGRVDEAGCGHVIRGFVEGA